MWNRWAWCGRHRPSLRRIICSAYSWLWAGSISRWLVVLISPALSLRRCLTTDQKIGRPTWIFFRGILFADKLLDFNVRERSTVLLREKLVTMATVTLGSAHHCLRSDSTSVAGGIPRTIGHWLAEWKSKKYPAPNQLNFSHTCGSAVATTFFPNVINVGGRFRPGLVLCRIVFVAMVAVCSDGQKSTNLIRG